MTDSSDNSSYRSLASKLLALLIIIATNPLLLGITLVIGVVFIAFGLGFIVYYNLATAIIFLVISGAAVLLLDAIHVLKFRDRPWIVGIPFLMALIGYGGQNVKFSLNGQEMPVIDASIAINPDAANPAAWILAECAIVILVIVIVAIVIKKIRQ